jgi:2-polyprenyl-3-methyl-5-hydroxy-6-metoxy-1,4-benzoquinol methylase
VTSKLAHRFNQRAGRYDNPWSAWIGEYELRKIRPLIPDNSRVLDFGCGTGRTSLDLLKRGCSVTAYDISHEMLAVAQSKIERAGLKAEFAFDESALIGKTWSYITCIGVLDYYSDPTSILEKLYEYLIPGGRLVVTFPNALSPLGWFYATGSKLTVPVYLCTPRTAINAIERAGYRLISLGYAFPGFRWIGLTLVLGLDKRHL